MLRVHDTEVVILKHIHEGKQGTINPPTPLVHQILMVFHRVCVGYGIWDVLQDILGIHLAINTQGKDTIFRQIHICLPEIFFFNLWVQNHFKVRSLQQIWLIFL